VTSKRIAIVSSYDESCGNAFFTDVLISSINRSALGWSAHPVGLNLSLNQSLGRLENRAADKQIDALALQLTDFDAVNIQFEAQLYGLLPSQIKRRLRALINSNPNVFVTYHSPRTVVSFTHRKQAIRQLLSARFVRALKSELENHRANFDVYMNRQILKSLAKKNVPVIVHTKRSETTLRGIFKVAKVYAHPLQFASRNQADKSRIESIRTELGLPEGVVLLGLFGYISKYKGHLEALDAMSMLPNNYHLVVAGRQHPQTLGNPDATRYISDVVEAVGSNEFLRSRTHFVGELENDDFEALVGAVDCCILPYHEVGQDGSGIASVCFELGQRVISSNSLAFDELFKLVPEYRSLRFDLQNPIELASKIVRLVSDSPTNATSEGFTLETQRDLYLRLSQQN